MYILMIVFELYHESTIRFNLIRHLNVKIYCYVYFFSVLRTKIKENSNF